MRIRALEEQDLEFIHRLNNDEAIMSYWFEEAYQSYEVLKKTFEKNLESDSERRFVIEDNDDVVGIVELVSISYVHRHCEIQIIVPPEHEGKGYAKEAFRRGVQYAFETLNLHKVYLFVDKDNKKAVHIYEKAGFIQEGIMQEQFYTKGEYHDAVFMGLLKKDWLKQQND
jgi:diamine N-acetyltransferase